jgi:hypothetical protein
VEWHRVAVVHEPVPQHDAGVPAVQAGRLSLRGTKSKSKRTVQAVTSRLTSLIYLLFIYYFT